MNRAIGVLDSWFLLSETFSLIKTGIVNTHNKNRWFSEIDNTVADLIRHVKNTQIADASGKCDERFHSCSIPLCKQWDYCGLGNGNFGQET